MLANLSVSAQNRLRVLLDTRVIQTGIFGVSEYAEHNITMLRIFTDPQVKRGVTRFLHNASHQVSSILAKVDLHTSFARVPLK